MVAFSLSVVAALQPIPEPVHVLRTAVSITGTSRGGRSPIRIDAIDRLIVDGSFRTPHPGDRLVGPDGTELVWQKANANADGWFEGRAAQTGTFVFPVKSGDRLIAILNAPGASMVYVNGIPRAGDPYQYGTTLTPVQLIKGDNVFVMPARRGRLRVTLQRPPALAFFNLGDATLPDAVRGENAPIWAGLIVVNAQDTPLAGAEIVARTAGREPMVTPVPTLADLGTRKVGVKVPPPGHPDKEQYEVELELRQANRSLFRGAIRLRIRDPKQIAKRTFLSGIDGSVQYYALNPAQTDNADALVLSLHGASVEALGQAEAYAPKRWANLVAATNRRPFGFDWEDWGRLDALEVLADARKRLRGDPSKTYLTGHSMGGHGTWHLGVTFPDLFAAIGPSAGWISFFTYAGGTRYDRPDPIESILNRATSPSDTLGLVTNLTGKGVYIVHGDADDNVPVTEARKMAEELGKFHRDWTLYEQKGAGHWWENSDEPGAECVDWAPMFDLFARRRIPALDEVREVTFSTANPGISSQNRWLAIEQQTTPMLVSSATVRVDPYQRRFVGTTQNVACLRLDMGTPPVMAAGTPFTVTLDGAEIKDVAWPSGGSVWLVQRAGGWTIGRRPGFDTKNPVRSGPFKDAFRHRMLFVIGTAGTPAENAALYAKARFDAEVFGYQGNGSIDWMTDRAFLSANTTDRGVILYGNAETNLAWRSLLGDSPVQVRRGETRIGDRIYRGDDLVCFFVRPRPNSAMASVAAVSDTGLNGIRLGWRAPYFTSGAAFPDVLLIGSDMLQKGTGGVRAAGFFGNDWSVTQGDFAFRPN